MTGHVSALAIRSALAWTQADMGRELYLTERSIRRIEKGIVTPTPSTQARLLALAASRVPAALPPGIRRHVIDPERMRHYLHSACPGWRHWSKPRRGQFRRWRLYYQRILADAQAGRAFIVYEYRYRARTPQARLARLLDDAPDLGLG
jgi:hypothetical protein